jgi:bifunctional DNA-binding transcriptional regulator/antitoxin component of YhaV-PrlF toxin-antitoxin module
MNEQMIAEELGPHLSGPDGAGPSAGFCATTTLLKIRIIPNAVLLYFCHNGSMMKMIEINERRALTMPKEIRERFGWTKGGAAIIKVTAEGILLAPGAAFPIEIYTPERLAEFAAEEAKLAKYDLK